MATITMNEESKVSVKMTESGAKEIHWNQFGRDCKSAGIKTIQDVMNDIESPQRISYKVEEMPLMRVPQELIDAIKRGEPFDWNPTRLDIIEDKKATVRTENGVHGATLGVVGNSYGIVDNMAAMGFIDFIKDVSGEEPIIETYGALGNGERIFVAARIGETNYLNPNDGINNYLVFTNSHNGTGSVMCFCTGIRIICQNTLNMAIKNAAFSINIKHTSKVNERIDWSVQKNRETAAEVFGKYKIFNEDFMTRMTMLKEQKVDENFIKDFVGSVCLDEKVAYPLFKKENFQVDHIEEISTKSKNNMIALRESIENGVGQEFNRGTKVWLLNGLTTYLQNGKTWKDEGQDKFNKIMFGTYADKVNKAYKFLMAA